MLAGFGLAIGSARAMVAVIALSVTRLRVSDTGIAAIAAPVRVAAVRHDSKICGCRQWAGGVMHDHQVAFRTCEFQRDSN